MNGMRFEHIRINVRIGWMCRNEAVRISRL